MRTVTKERDGVDAAVEGRSAVVAVAMVEEVELLSTKIYARQRCGEGIDGKGRWRRKPWMGFGERDVTIIV